MKAAPANLRLRILVLAAVLAASGLVLIARAAQLQVVSPEFYVEQGNERFLRDVPIVTARGMITDRNGEPLAVSTPVESVWANPQELLQHPDRLPELATALELSPDELTRRLSQRASREFVYLRRHMNPDVAQAVLARGIPGVYSQREFRRFYPHGEALSHVLGFTNVDDRGQEGLELAFDDWLRGEPGLQRVIRERRGRIVEHVDLLQAPRPGRDLALSIDRRLQYLAYRELKAALQSHGASSGSVVILDVPTGEVLAMVNQPSFNPNSRGHGSQAARRNRAVTDLIEPGSVIKAVTVAAALEDGVDPGIVIQTSPGTMPLAGHVIRDVHDYGPVTLTRLLTKSSNIGAARLALGMSDEHFHDVLQRFGYGRSTGSGFPGEAAGVLPAPEGWGQLEKATISYGYGLSATPLQIAQAYAVLANGGRRVAPTFVRGGNLREGRIESARAIDPAIAAQLLGMLETVTGPEGTAQRAAIDGYRVAGKTGTSRIAVAGGYDRRYISLFAGIVPVSNPRFVMVVVIQEPNRRDNGSLVYYGGSVAAPVFHNVMDGALRLMDVPPDRIEEYVSRATRPQSSLVPVGSPQATAVPAAAEATPAEAAQ
jgi:cell division protein FtsI (penicillin-binding protein 3)